MSKNYTKIKGYYDTGLWDKRRVYNVVGRATGITAEEYELITGEPYVPGEAPPTEAEQLLSEIEEALNG
jgi:hypothetical protein